jgi:ATP synthase protein I
MTVATRIALYQLAIALGAGLVWWWAAGAEQGGAAIAGGTMSAVVSLYAGIKTFSNKSTQPALMLRRFYRAQAWKLLISIAIFMFAIHLLGRDFLPFISAYAVSLSAYWFSLLWDD